MGLAVAIFNPRKRNDLLTSWLCESFAAIPDDRRAQLKIAPTSDDWLYFLFMHINPHDRLMEAENGQLGRPTRRHPGQGLCQLSD